MLADEVSHFLRELYRPLVEVGDELGTQARRAVGYRELLVDVAGDEWVSEGTQA
jgi:hypothetical protein